ncbi:MAG: tyrosine-protein kinase Etk/Wzc [Bdellovibrionota bacterium]|jgi:tyrosine-protein kinase Etk/Wzc
MARNKQGDTSPPPHLLGVLRSLWQWRKPIVFVTIAGTVLAAIISLLLPVYYSASTTFLTISPDQISIDGVFGNTSGRMQFYGTGDDIDRAMSVAESDALVDRLIKKFDLYTVYDIDTTKAKAPLYVRREFMGNYEVKKNARDAIELEIRDQDPIRVAAMVREARNQVNDISLTLVRGTQQRSAQSLRSEITSAEANLTSIDKRIRELRERSGVYNTEAQSEALGAKTTSLQNSIVTTEAKLESYRRNGGKGGRDSIAKYRVQLAGYESARINLDTQLVRLNTSLGPLDNLEEERRRLNDALSKNRIRLKQYETILGTDMRAIEVVEDARIPVAKSSPIRSLIVIGALVFSFIAALVGALLIDSGRRYDWTQVFKE